jgi:ribonuclease Y
MATNTLIAVGLSAIIAAAIGYFARYLTALKGKNTLEAKAKDRLNAAEIEAKEILLSAKTEASSVLSEAQRDERERKQELRRLEDHLLKKEASIDKQQNEVQALSQKKHEELERLKITEEEIKEMKEKAVHELERVVGLSREDAKKQMFHEIEQTSQEELREKIIRLEREKLQEIEARALEVITSSLQRYARSSITDITTSVVNLPSEEIKGKIIGREGRNIRTFERLTGVEVIVDDTPESIILSSFDPMRRELAKIALQKLIKDGRIQPAKIEEKVEEARQELDEYIRKAGEDAAYEVGILDLPKEIVFLLGRLNYRSSYGQNVLQHSIEMSHIAGMIAAELGLNVDVAKKGALLHDLGKAIDHEVEGTHVEIGRKLLKKYNIAEPIIKAMESHHEEYPFSTPESYVVAAADVISGARPGARRDTLEKYIKRLEDVERVVKTFEGINQAYAVAAGREVRVFVTPEKIDDFGALQLAKQIAAKIQSEVHYPGEIKVTVIREVKAVEYAR